MGNKKQSKPKSNPKNNQNPNQKAQKKSGKKKWTRSACAENPGSKERLYRLGLLYPIEKDKVPGFFVVCDKISTFDVINLLNSHIFYVMLLMET